MQCQFHCSFDPRSLPGQACLAEALEARTLFSSVWAWALALAVPFLGQAPHQTQMLVLQRVLSPAPWAVQALVSVIHTKKQIRADGDATHITANVVESSALPEQVSWQVSVPPVVALVLEQSLEAAADLALLLDYAETWVGPSAAPQPLSQVSPSPSLAFQASSSPASGA